MIGDKKRKIGICTLYTKEVEEYAMIGADDKAMYAARHGYDLIRCECTLCPERPPSWSKLLLLQEKLAQYDWLWWVDCDTLIMEHDKDINDFLRDDFDMIIGVDENNRLPNCGSFFARNSMGMTAFLKAWWAMDQNVFDPIWEQRAFFDLCVLKRIPTIGFVPAAHFNSYYFLYQPKQFLVHFTGTKIVPTTQERAEMMREWLPKRYIPAPAGMQGQPTRELTIHSP